MPKLSHRLKLSVGNYKVPHKDSLPLLLFNRLPYIEGILPKVSKQLTHAYCIGLPRSGTHTLAHILGNECRTIHEPLKKKTIHFIINRMPYASHKEINKWLLLRDKVLGIDIEATHFLHYFAGNLSTLFPKAKFILTIRDPLEWLESELNRNYSASKSAYWRALEEYRYNLPSLAHETINEVWQPSNERIASYITYWKNHIERTTQSVPENRLLLLNTKDLNHSKHTIYNFLGLDPESKPDNTIKRKGVRKENPIKLSNSSIETAQRIIKNMCSTISYTPAVIRSKTLF